MENAKLLTEAQIEALHKVAELATQAITYIAQLLKRVAECICEIVRKALENFPNTRVIHLATKHGDPKVRKKNMNRIVQWVRRYVRCRG